MSLLEQDVFIFDLDRTIWDTYDARNQKIWAKQLVPPFQVKDQNTIIDDVGSYCVLKKGITEFISELSNRNKKIGFLSVGALWDYKEKYQPSLILLKMFNLYKYFNDEKILKYKTYSKCDFLKTYKKCVFFDDDEKHLLAVKDLENVFEVDSTKITDWRNIL